MKHFIALLSLLALVLTGCETTQGLGEPSRTIENPYNEQEAKKIADSYVMNMELWRKDPNAVCQIEVYKLEGKNAVLLDRKIIKDSRKLHIQQVTTRKNIYVFRLELPEFIQQTWWVSRIDIYDLPSQRAEDNPALKDKSTPEMREPTSLQPVEDPNRDANKDPAPWDPTLP